MSSDTSQEVYPPGEWGNRPSPEKREVETALSKAQEWWPYAVNRGDDCLRSFLDLFERHLASEVENRQHTIGSFRGEADV